MSFWNERRRAVAASPRQSAAAAASAMVMTAAASPSCTGPSCFDAVDGKRNNNNCSSNNVNSNLNVYRLVEAADRKNKVLSADPRRTLHRTLLQRRHYQGLREAAAQLERSRQADLMREQQLLQDQMTSMRFCVVSGQQEQQQLSPTQSQVLSSQHSQTHPAMAGISRPAHFNPALLRTKESHNWASNQWTASPVVSVAASIVSAPSEEQKKLDENMHDDDDDDDHVTFATSNEKDNSFEQEWLQATLAAASDNESVSLSSSSLSSSSLFCLPLGTAGVMTAAAAAAAASAVADSTPEPAPSVSRTSSSSSFALPCGTAGLFQQQKQSEVKQQEQQQEQEQEQLFKQQTLRSTLISALPSSSSVASRRGMVSQGREWGCGEKRMDSSFSYSLFSENSSSSAESFSHISKKLREEDFSSNSNSDSIDGEEKSMRIGFASSPFQWQPLFDPAQLQQVLCN